MKNFWQDMNCSTSINLEWKVINWDRGTIFWLDQRNFWDCCNVRWLCMSVPVDSYLWLLLECKPSFIFNWFDWRGEGVINRDGVWCNTCKFSTGCRGREIHRVNMHHKCLSSRIPHGDWDLTWDQRVAISSSFLVSLSFLWATMDLAMVLPAIPPLGMTQ